jgi:hypothetical protein
VKWKARFSVNREAIRYGRQVASGGMDTAATIASACGEAEFLRCKNSDDPIRHLDAGWGHRHPCRCEYAT